MDTTLLSGIFVLIKTKDMSMHFNLPLERKIYTYPTNQGNQITKEYYNFLVGEINRGTIYKAVCRIENKVFGTESYYLISER